MTNGECRLMLAMATVAYDRVLSDELVNMWSEFLGDILLDEGLIAMRAHIAEIPNFPTVADIRGRVQEARAPKVNVVGAWDEVQKAIVRCGWHHEPRIWSSPAVEAAVRALGWDSICHASRGDGSASKLRARFERYLRAGLDMPEYAPLAELVDDEPSRTRGRR